MRKLLAMLLLVVAGSLALSPLGCGSSAAPAYNFGGGDGGPDATLEGGHATPDAVTVLSGGDAFIPSALPPLIPCADGGSGDGGGGMTATLTGKVYDPAGKNPLYNVYVYVPTTSLEPIPSGPVCTQCQAPASGSPMTSASTAADGTFTLANVPSGANVPIVLQLGKWRRHLTISTCSGGPAPADGFFRLPRKQAETSPDDNIPLIAFTTGCDAAECFLVGRVGIDASEFTPPTGTGRVHMYAGDGLGPALQLWSTLSDWMKYDIVFDACECAPLDRGGSGTTNLGYANFLAYLNAGGRAFATHFFYNFFADPMQCLDGTGSTGFLTDAGTVTFDAATGGASSSCHGQGALPMVASWEANTGQAFAPAAMCPNSAALGVECMSIDTTIPKGAAFAQWYQANNAQLGGDGGTGGGEAYGYVGLTDIRADMGPLPASLVSAGAATPWLYAGDLGGAYDAYYMGFNTPVGAPLAQQCGRAIFSDVHLDGSGGDGAFPSYCQAASAGHGSNELALEFLFFDLSSCVQDDTAPPPPPPSK